jgi:Flp pilus assembly pilin Flp
MKYLLKSFVREEAGQDMVEYVLILAFVCVGAAAIITTVGQDIRGVWTITSSHLVNANTAAAS